MKILHLMDEPYDSGLTSSALNLAQLLALHGVKTGVLARGGSYALQQAKLRALGYFEWSGAWPLAYREIADWIDGEGFDLLHAHTGSMHSLAWLLSRRRPSLAVMRTRADARRVKKLIFYDRLLKDTKYMIFPMKAIREEFLVTYHYPIDRTKVIYPSIDGLLETRRFDQGPAPVMDGQGWRVKTVTIVGRLDPVKGHRDFLQAMAMVLFRFPNVEAQIIGAEKNIKAKELELLAQKLGVASKVKFFGFLDAAKLAEAMRRSDIGVIASRGSEAVSRVSLEWMSLGKPVVGTKVGMIPELIRNAETGFLVPPGSYEEMAYALGRLLKDEALSRRFGENGRKIYEKFFTPAACLKEHLAVYESLIDARV
ncbi:MAG: glycosyltransferase family 4 protein [Elusimicrobia bacterium]|nr:glycosyltransferase family 4 protein [Elusimicrobiota bacterium]